MIQIAVRDDNKGHIDDFREKTYEKNRTFFGKKLLKIPLEFLSNFLWYQKRELVPKHCKRYLNRVLLNP